MQVSTSVVNPFFDHVAEAPSFDALATESTEVRLKRNNSHYLLLYIAGFLLTLSARFSTIAWMLGEKFCVSTRRMKLSSICTQSATQNLAKSDGLPNFEIVTFLGPLLFSILKLVSKVHVAQGSTSL